MNYKEFNQQISQEITQKLQLQVAQKNPRINYLEKQYNHYSESLFGGKMIRGMLVCLGYMLAGKKVDDQILEIASAFEVVHSALLIHDDIIDQGRSRRGRPSLHVALGNDKKGESLALCFGDLGLVWSAQIINNTNFNVDQKQKAIDFYCNKIQQTIVGQLLDIELSKVSVKSEEHILKMYELKTATYSFVAPLCVGAILGGADLKQLSCIENFGTQLGIAFQIQDDIIGIFGDERVTGKSVNSDIKEGKNTLLISYAARNATKDELKILNKYYGSSSIRHLESEKVRAIFIATGALNYSQKWSTNIIEVAEEIIPTLTQDPQMRELLQEFLQKMVNRKK